MPEGAPTNNVLGTVRSLRDAAVPVLDGGVDIVGGVAGVPDQGEGAARRGRGSGHIPPWSHLNKRGADSSIILEADSARPTSNGFPAKMKSSRYEVLCCSELLSSSDARPPVKFSSKTRPFGEGMRAETARAPRVLTP